MSGKLLLSAKKDAVLSNRPGYDMSALQPCNHPEADTRILLHLAHAGANGHEKAFVRTVDSDVVILAIRFTELWIGFAGGKNYSDIPAHEVSKNLGPQKSLALPLFHALTGCDTTSAFLGHGKKSAWAAWEATPDLTESLVTLTSVPEQINNDVHVQRLEHMVVIMYSKSCGSSRVDEARSPFLEWYQVSREPASHPSCTDSAH